MLTRPKRPTALLALNDRELIEILDYTKNLDITIPEDVALIGIDDVSFTEFYHPALTTVAQSAFATELLLRKIKNTRVEGTNEIH